MTMIAFVKRLSLVLVACTLVGANARCFTCEADCRACMEKHECKIIKIKSTFYATPTSPRTPYKCYRRCYRQKTLESFPCRFLYPDLKYRYVEYRSTGCLLSYTSEIEFKKKSSNESIRRSYPTLPPTQKPTRMPTEFPSFLPTTRRPTPTPSKVPTTAPTLYPSMLPSPEPTPEPTNMPSASPSKSPSYTPTSSPSILPSTSPTLLPSTNPTRFPSTAPTSRPSSAPTVMPTQNPTTQNGAKCSSGLTCLEACAISGSEKRGKCVSLSEFRIDGTQVCFNNTDQSSSTACKTGQCVIYRNGTGFCMEMSTEATVEAIVSSMVAAGIIFGLVQSGSPPLLGPFVSFVQLISMIAQLNLFHLASDLRAFSAVHSWASLIIFRVTIQEEADSLGSRRILDSTSLHPLQGYASALGFDPGFFLLNAILGLLLIIGVRLTFSAVYSYWRSDEMPFRRRCYHSLNELVVLLVYPISLALFFQFWQLSQPGSLDSISGLTLSILATLLSVCLVVWAGFAIERTRRFMEGADRVEDDNGVNESSSGRATNSSFHKQESSFVVLWKDLKLAYRHFWVVDFIFGILRATLVVFGYHMGMVQALCIAALIALRIGTVVAFAPYKDYGQTKCVLVVDVFSLVMAAVLIAFGGEAQLLANDQLRAIGTFEIVWTFLALVSVGALCLFLLRRAEVKVWCRSKDDKSAKQATELFEKSTPGPNEEREPDDEQREPEGKMDLARTESVIKADHQENENVIQTA